VGRANVGKSTLFNRISGRRQAITDSRPGSTRDRNHAQVEWLGAAFEVIDTGGLLLETDDPLLGPAADQARRAIDEADLVVLVVDARAGRLPDDEAIARELRRGGKRVLLAVNKAEAGTDATADFAPLGFESTFAISAEHGQGVGDLLDAALEGLPRTRPEEDARPPLKLALVGRPNVGKSSLLNRLLGDERAVVSEVPGTTRDSVDSRLERDGHIYLLVDTAGIRRVRHLKEAVDHVSVVQARKAIGRADVAVVVLDASEGPREMDAAIAGEAVEAGVGVVVAVNKWDLAGERGLKTKSFEQRVRERLKFLPWARLVFLSARTGRGIPALFKAVGEAQAGRVQRVTTGVLNRLIGRATERQTPQAARGGRPVRILFSSQIGIAPPTFALSINQPGDLHFSYKRYLENEIRRTFGFQGTPLRFKVRQRSR
jgi:GTP-binding protein